MRISEILCFLEEKNIPFTFRGNKNDFVENFSSLANYKSGTFTWVKKQESLPTDFNCRQVALVFVSEGVVGDFPNIIETPQSKHAFFSTIEHFYVQPEEYPPIGQFTYISPKVKLGENVRIGHNCTLDGDIIIEDDTVIWNGVTIIGRVHIGQRCEIQSGVVIGHCGIAYTEDEDHNKFPIKHFGGVWIGNNVHIAKGASIDCGVIDDTTIEDGVIIDGLSRVAHNCIVKKNAVLVLPTTLCGSVQVGEGAYLSGCSVRNQCKIGKGAFVGMGSVVVRDIRENATVSGNPAREFLPPRQS